jgi:hypothetical protein
MFNNMAVVTLVGLLLVYSNLALAGPSTTQSAEDQGSDRAAARAAVLKYVGFLRDHDTRNAARMLYADTVADTYIVDSVATLAVAEAHFQDKLFSKFGEKAADNAWSFSKRIDKVEAAELELVDNDHIKMLMDVNGTTQTITMKRVENSWRLPTSSVVPRISTATPPDIVALRYGQMAEMYDRVSTQVEAGKYTSVYGAVTAVVDELSRIASGDDAQH